MNLNNLWHLENTLSINDFYDVVEAMDVAFSWEKAAHDNVKEEHSRTRGRR